MTIKEAVLLVIQALSQSKGGEIFLLDMGEPVKIKKLAEQMIRLSGNKLEDETNKNDGIPIKYIGLRPGEKLYEELLIDAKAESTQHPLIFKANEKSLSEEKLFSNLNELKKLIDNNNIEGSLFKLKECVPEWNRNYDIN